MQNLLQCYGAKKVSFLCYHGTPIQTLFLGLGHAFRQPGTRDELTQRTSLDEEAIDGNQRLKSRQCFLKQWAKSKIDEVCWIRT